MSSPKDTRYAERSRAVIRVLWLTLGLNALVATTKIVIGALAGNLTVLADGFHSLLDGANNIIGIVVITLAMRPPDETHPYGHRKFEHVAAMAIGGLVMLLAWEMVKNVYTSFRSGAPSDPSVLQPLTLVLIGGTLAVNLFVAWYERREGERLNSSLLKADAAHTSSDVMITAGSILSLVLAPLVWWLDPLLALVVVGFLLHAAWSILSDNVATMTDRQRLDPAKVRHEAESVEGVIDAHAIRSHGMENDIHIDLHIVVDGELKASDVTLIEDRVRKHLKEAFPEVTMVSVKHETERPPDTAPVWKSR